MSVNAGASVIPALRTKRYNLSLATACLLFIPLAIFYFVTQNTASLIQSIGGLLIAPAIHLSIIAYAPLFHQSGKINPISTVFCFEKGFTTVLRNVGVRHEAIMPISQ
jgi:hypothetical protein